MEGLDYSDEQIEGLIAAIFSQKVTIYNLPEGLYRATADYLKKGLYKGFGKTLAEVKFGGPDYALLKKLRENIYIFSAAKTFHQVRDINDAIIKDDRVVPFNEFKKEADKIFKQYNDNWLKSEYDTAIAQARNAESWQTFEREKQQFQMLRYNAVIDEVTCKICSPLDKITLPVDHPFWKKFMPQNHFSCRCIVEQYKKEEVRETSTKKVLSVAEKVEPRMQPTFLMNPGLDKVVFKERGPGNHPYFDIEPRFMGMAHRNFGLTIPNNDE